MPDDVRHGRVRLAVAILTVGVLVAGCGGTSAATSPNASAAGTGASSAVGTPRPSGTPEVAPALPPTTRCAAIDHATLPSDRSYDTVMDGEHGLLTVTYNSASNPNETMVVDFLTDPTCVPGTRIWAVIDGAVSGAVEYGNSPWRVGVAYPHALYTHGGVAETRFAGQYWAPDDRLSGYNAPNGWTTRISRGRCGSTTRAPPSSATTPGTPSTSPDALCRRRALERS